MNSQCNDLPDYLPGNPEMYGVQQQADQYFQGTSIIIPAVLTDNGLTVNYSDYFIKVILKADLSSSTIVWYGYENYGLFYNNGIATINIPANITSQLPFGVYYISIVGKLKTDPNRISILFNNTISINPSAASPIDLINYDLTAISPKAIVPVCNSQTPDISVPIEYFSI